MSLYSADNASLQAIADEIRAQTGKNGGIVFPAGFVSDINSLAIKHGVLRHDAELIRSESYDGMLVADKGAVIPAYTTAATTIVAAENILPTMQLDTDAYDYRVLVRTLTIPVYSDGAVMARYWHEYYATAAIIDIVRTLANEFKTLDGNTGISTRPTTVVSQSTARGAMLDPSPTLFTSSTYGIRQVTTNPAISSSMVMTLKTPSVQIRGNSKSFPTACWDAMTDARLQYVIDVYRSPKRGKDTDGFELLHELKTIASCVNSADHKLL